MGASMVYGDLEDEVPPFGDDLMARSRAGIGYGDEGWALGRQEKVQVKEKEGLTGVVFKHHSFLIASEVSSITPPGGEAGGWPAEVRGVVDRGLTMAHA